MNKSKETATVKAHPARALRAELAHKIASFLGNEEKRITEILGMSLHRRTSPTPPCRTTYHPGIIVVAQGAKQVNLGQKSFIYDESNYLLTAVDLPIVSWVAKATEEMPCLVLSLKLDIAMVRELLSREEIHIADAPSDSPAMSIGETTPEFLSACCRLLDLLKRRLGLRQPVQALAEERTQELSAQQASHIHGEFASQGGRGGGSFIHGARLAI